MKGICLNKQINKKGAETRTKTLLNRLYNFLIFTRISKEIQSGESQLILIIDRRI